MGLFDFLNTKIQEELERQGNEIMSNWNSCSVCGCKICSSKEAEFGGMCEDCFYDRR